MFISFTGSNQTLFNQSRKNLLILQLQIVLAAHTAVANSHGPRPYVGTYLHILDKSLSSVAIVLYYSLQNPIVTDIYFENMEILPQPLPMTQQTQIT